MKKSLTMTLVLAGLAVFAGPGIAQQQHDRQMTPPTGGLTKPAPPQPPVTQRVTTIKASKSNSSDRLALDNVAPRLLQGKVAEVDSQARIFAVAVVFSAAKLSALPTVGEIVDITYTQTPGGGPMEVTTIKGSKSNQNELMAADNASPKLKGTVMEVNNRARTFTLAVVFSAAKLSKDPTVGQVVDVTYTESANGAPARASNLNLSKSNIN